MGLGGVGITQLLIILAIVVLIFGTKRVRQFGGDLGGMIRGVRDGLKDVSPVVDEFKDLQDDVQELEDKVKGRGQRYVRSEIADFDD